MKKNPFRTIYYCVILLCTVEILQAQIPGNPQLKSVDTQQRGISKSTSKLSPELKSLYEKYSAEAIKTDLKSRPKLPGDEGLHKYMHVQGDMVLVDITVKGGIKPARAELEKMGMKVSGVFGRVISGMIPIRALPGLETSANIRFARPAYNTIHQSGPSGSIIADGLKDLAIKPVISQGDTAQRSYVAREKYKVNGKGVKVGILSDSYDNQGKADIGVTTGELPGPGNPFNFKKPVQVLTDLDSGGTDEGRAMAEIVHDVAPGAEIAFHTAFGGQAVFAQGILDLANAGCKVIVDDALNLGEPFFQDGIVAQAVDIVKKKGVSYFSSAGNRSIRSYESDYRASLFEPLGEGSGTAHNFSAPADAPRYFQPIFIPTNGNFLASFQWDQPFFSAGGAGAESDLDMYLFDAQGRLVALSIFDNIAGGDALEILGFTNTTTSNTFFLTIVKFAGPDPSRLKYIIFGDGAFFLTTPSIPGILAPTLIGHAKAEGAIAVGAAFFKNTPAFGVDTPLVESFSSKGGVANYFDKMGNRISPEIRKKPEITAPDGGNTSFFFSDSPQDTDTFPNFFGTSASAPHAAAVAALMIDAQKLRTITPGQIKGVLSSNTVDMDDVYTTGFDEGFDFNTGTGLIKADAAVGVVRFPNLYVKNLNLETFCSDNPAMIINWKIINPNPFDVEVHWFIVGSPMQGNLIVPPGESNYTTPTFYYQNNPVPNIAIIDWKDNFGFPRFDIVAGSTVHCGNVAALKNDHDKALENDVYAGTNHKPNTAEVYPNPSSSNFRLYLSLAKDQHAEVVLYTVDGKTLYKKLVPANGIVDIDASNYKPGIFILTVRQGQFNKTIKLIKK